MANVALPASDLRAASASVRGLQPPAKTDPALLVYEETARFRSPHTEPRRLACGPEDQLLLCAGNQVSVLTLDGQPALEIVVDEAARCAAAAADGRLYVGLRDHLEVFSAKGERLARWPSPSQRSWLTGVVVTAEAVFAGDSGQRAVLRYDRSGKLLGRIGTKDPDRNIPGLHVPSPFLDVELGRDGLLYVNNFGRHRVEGYTFDGDLEASWGRPSLAMPGFCGCCNPVGLAALPDGRFVTCEKGVPRVKVYSARGEFESVVAGPESFPENARACTSLNDCVHGGLDVAADSRGRVYVLDLVTRNISVMQRKQG